MRVWDEQGAVSAWSAPSRFETAFLEAVRLEGRLDRPRRQLAAAAGGRDARRRISASSSRSPPTSDGRGCAISGLGYNEVELNGEKVGDHVLDPAWTGYDKTALYESFDVTEALRNGDNALGVTLGRGYLASLYAAGDAFPWVVAPWTSEQKLLLQLDVELGRRHAQADRLRRLAGRSPTARSCATASTSARSTTRAWSSPAGASPASTTPAGTTRPSSPPPTTRLRAQAMSPVRVTETLQPVRVSEPRAGVKVYDFGTMTAGWSRLRVKGAAGTTIRLLHGERLNADGTVAGRGDIHGAPSEAQVDSYTLRGGDGRGRGSRSSSTTASATCR